MIVGTQFGVPIPEGYPFFVPIRFFVDRSEAVHE